MSLLLLLNNQPAVVHASASIAEAHDSVSAVSAVLVSLSGSIVDGDDSLAASISTSADVTTARAAGGYIRRVQAKPKQPVKPRRPVKLTARISEQGDSVLAVSRFVVAAELVAVESADAVYASASQDWVAYDNEILLVAA